MGGVLGVPVRDQQKSVNRMKLAVVLWIGLVGLVGTAVAEKISLPRLITVVRMPGEADEDGFGARFRDLARRSHAFQTDTKQFNTDCRGLKPGSPKVAQCRAALATLVQTGTDLREEILAFNADYRASSSWPGEPLKVSVQVREARGKIEFYSGDRVVQPNSQGYVVITRVKTGADGKAKLILPDGTEFSFGANTEFEMDEFIYDPTVDTKEMVVDCIKGFFRFVTGKLAETKKRIRPTNIKIRLPVGSMGIRGTDFLVNVEPSGETRVAVLEGTVELAPDAAEAVFLRAGEEARVAADAGTVSRISPGVDALRRSWAKVIE